MLLTITIDSEEAKRILDMAWEDIHATVSLDEVPKEQIRSDKRLLESFRLECESAKGSKL